MPSTAEIALLRKAMFGFFNEQRQCLHQAQIGTSDRLLVWLGRRGTLSQAELGRICALEKSWISRAVDRLVQRGLVEKSPCLQDRRGVLLTLSEAGAAEAARIEALLDEHARSVLQRLPAEARPEVMQALQVLDGLFVDAGER
ncbi:MarR family transcriptional regulator [Neisseriaceae bacterium JH1-16]|nr:MarR family transcriptional regulator [Neisseriaceae bacterium JH1-16]